MLHTIKIAIRHKTLLLRLSFQCLNQMCYISIGPFIWHLISFIIFTISELFGVFIYYPCLSYTHPYTLKQTMAERWRLNSNFETFEIHTAIMNKEIERECVVVCLLYSVGLLYKVTCICIISIIFTHCSYSKILHICRWNDETVRWTHRTFCIRLWLYPY